MRHHRLTRSAALGLALVALAAPTAAAQSQDLRSPDTRDAAVATQVRQDLRSTDTRDAAVATRVRQDQRSTGTRDAAVATRVRQDQRSPDTRDAAVATRVRQDLRSPDARDAAEDRGTFSAPEVTVVKLYQPSPSVGGGVDWRDAGVGAGTMLALMLGIGIMHRRHGAPARRELARIA